MPITVDFGGLDEYIRRLVSGAFLEQAVNNAINAAQLNLETRIPVDSGKTAAAMSAIYSAEPSGPMQWTGGIGNMEMVGEPTDAAPEGTLDAFYKWYRSRSRD